jgi:WD40 repeat protein
MAAQLDSAVVRFRDPGGAVVGAGFLVGDRQVLTCAHVATRALGLPEEVTPPPEADVPLDFPLIAPGGIVMARISIWHAPSLEPDGDIAGLELTGRPPPEARPVRLLVADELWRHEFRTFGFPPGYDDGVWASGRLLARQAMQWIQMEDVKETGYRVEPGFSGAPVWDDDLDGVVGMTVAAERRPELRSAFLIPAGMLVDAWPLLATQATPPSPYRGMLAFREQDANRFFGREDLVDQLVDRLASSRFLGLVGPSGSGKSSLAFAGVIPHIRQRQDWVVADLRPGTGSSPLAALASALLLRLDPSLTETERLVQIPALATVLGDGRLGEVVERMLERADAHRLLLLIDQFEELLAQRPDVIHQFIDVLAKATANPAGPASPTLTVLLTLRADFLAQALDHAPLVEALRGSVLVVGRMTREQLRRAIEGPVGHEVIYEPGLVDRILDDVGEEAGSLPLLQFTLTLLWERQRRRTLTHAAYAELGGVNGAVARYAEQLYLNELGQQDRAVVRRVFVQLVKPGEKTGPVRRVASRTDLDEVGWRIAQRLAGTRLVVTGRDLAGLETVELVHEALIEHWDRLRGWVEEDRIFRIWQERLRSALTQWEQNGRDEGTLLRGVPLAEAERWLEQQPADISPAERIFIAASQAAQRRELVTVKRRNRRLRMLTASLALLSVLVFAFGVLAMRSTREAREQARLATSRRLAALADAKMDTDPTQSILLALAALRTADTLEARSSLLQEVDRRRGVRKYLVGHTNAVRDVVFSKDGHLLASVGTDRAVLLWDPRTGTRIGKPLLGHRDAVNAAAFSPDGRILATGGADNTLLLWDPRTGARIGKPLTGHPIAVTGIGFSDSGRTLTSVDQDGSILRWDVDRGTRRWLHRGQSLSGAGVVAAFGPDRTMATADLDGVIRVWDLEHGMRPTTLGGRAGPISSMAFSSDGQALAAGGDNGVVTVWNVRQRTRRKTLPGNAGRITSVAFSPDGRTLASGGADKILRLWQGDSEPESLTGHGGAVSSLKFSPDGRVLVSGGADGAVIAWDAQRRARFRMPRGQTGPVTSVAFSPDSRLLATGDDDGITIVWDLRSGARRWALPQRSGWVKTVAFSPDGRTLATGGADNSLVLWQGDRPTRLPSVTKAYAWITSVAFSRDGQTLAAASSDGTVSLWDPTQAARRRVLTGQGSWVTSLAFSQDGRLLAVASVDHKVALWDPQTGQRRHVLNADTPVNAVAFSPDGQTLASGSDDRTVTLWDPRAGQRRQVLTGHEEQVTSLAFSQDGRLLASGGVDNTVLLWPVGHNTPLGSLTGHRGRVMSVAFSPDGRTLASGGDDSMVLLWDLEVTSWQQRLCGIVGRDLTDAERQELLPGSSQGPTCA